MPDTIESKVIADPDGAVADTAQATIEAQGFSVARNNVISPTVPLGDVISHTITAVDSGHLVTLTVSLGADPVVVYPSVLAQLSPPTAPGDVIDADLVTDQGHAVTMDVDGTYTVAGLSWTADSTDITVDSTTLTADGFGGAILEWFQVRLYDYSMSNWHVQSGESGYRVYVGGTIRLPDVQDELQADALDDLEALGLTVEIVESYSETIDAGDAISTFPPKWSLLRSDTPVQLFVSLGLATGDFTEASALGSSFGAVKAAQGLFTAGIGAGFDDSRVSTKPGTIVEAMQADEIVSALQTAAAAVLEGIEAGEAWAGYAVAAAQLAAAGEFGASFLLSTETIDNVSFSAETQAAASYQGAAARLAALTTGATLHSAQAGLAMALASIATGAQVGAAFTAGQAKQLAIVAGVSAAYIAQARAISASAFNSLASLGMVTSGRSVTRAQLTSVAAMASTFNAFISVQTLNPVARRLSAGSPNWIIH